MRPFFPAFLCCLPLLAAAATTMTPTTTMPHEDLPRQLRMPSADKLPPECANTTCFRKCCPPGQTFSVNKGCQPSRVRFDPFVYPNSNLSDWRIDTYFLVVGTDCQGDWAGVEWEDNGTHSITSELQSDGRLTIYEDVFNKLISSTSYDQREYCLEYYENETNTAFICTKSTKQAGAFVWLYTFGLLVSVSGLLVTLGVYMAVETLRDLHGKSLACHAGALAIAYTLLAAVQLSGDAGLGNATCRGVAFAIQFFLLFSFFWLHVMCLDAFWAVMAATGSSPFSYPRAKKWMWIKQKKFWVVDAEELDERTENELKEQEKNIERRVFFGYCVYASFLSVLPVLLTSIQELSPTIPATYVDHNMKLHSCQFDSERPSLKYFYPLIALIEVVNIILFIWVLVKAYNYTWNPRGLQRVPKQKARMCFILFILMSSNWLTDVISWALGGEKFAWIMLHAFNILQGLVTFCIFVLEDRVKDCIKRTLWPQLKLIRRKYKCCKSEEPAEETSTTPGEMTVMLSSVHSTTPGYH